MEIKTYGEFLEGMNNDMFMFFLRWEKEKTERILRMERFKNK